MFDTIFLKHLVSLAMDTEIKEGLDTLQVETIDVKVDEEKSTRENLVFDAFLEVRGSDYSTTLEYTIPRGIDKTGITLARKERCIYQGEDFISDKEKGEDFKILFDEEDQPVKVQVEGKDYSVTDEIPYKVSEEVCYKMRYVLTHAKLISLDTKIPETIDEEFLKLMTLYRKLDWRDVPETPSDYDFLTVEENLLIHIKNSRPVIRRNIWNKWRGNSRMKGHQLSNKELQNHINRFFSMTTRLTQSVTKEIDLGKSSLQTTLNTNPASIKGQGRKIYFYDGTEVLRVYNSSFIGILDPTKTSEGPNINKYNELSKAVSIENHRPYLNLVNRRGEKVCLPFYEVGQARILSITSWDFHKGKEIVSCSHGDVEISYLGFTRYVSPDEWDYRWEEEDSQFSITTSLIPFLNRADHTRGLLGAHMEDQAIPCIGSKPCPVYTQENERLYLDTETSIRAEQEGEVLEVTEKEIKLSYGTVEKPDCIQSLAKTSNVYKSEVKKGDKVKEGDVLYSLNSFKDREYAISVPTLVAVTSFYTREFEDAQVIREGFAPQFSHDLVHKVLIPLKTKYKYIIEEGEETETLDPLGIIKVGAKVKGGDVLLSFKRGLTYSDRAALLSRMLEAEEDVVPFEIRLDKNIPEGEVKRVKIELLTKKTEYDFSHYEVETKEDESEKGIFARVVIEIEEIRKADIGDKLTNLYGGKGTISLVCPDDEMLHTEKGEIPDLIVQSQTFLTRKIPSMVFEGLLGRICQLLYRKTKEEGITDTVIEIGSLIYPHDEVDYSFMEKKYKEAEKYGYFRIKVGIFENGYSVENINKAFTLLGLNEDGSEYLVNPKTGHRHEYPTMLLFLAINRLCFFPSEKAKATPTVDLTGGNLVLGGGHQRPEGQKVGIQETFAMLANGIDKTLRSIRDPEHTLARYNSEWMLLGYLPEEQ